MARTALHATSAASLLLLCSTLLHAQSAPARHSEISAYEQYVAYWTTEPGWRTELQLRNNLDPGELTVAPALRTADGTETALPPVTIKSGDVASLDVGDTVLKAAPRLVGTYGSLVLRYRATVHRALYAAVMVRIDGRPIAFHLDAYSHNLSPGRASREGIWWLPRESVTDFLILANSGDQKLVPTLTLYDSSGKAWHQQLSLGPHQTQRLSVRTLLQRAGLSGRYGGIKIDGADTAGYLDSAHLLFDEVGGFSANMKMFNHDPDIPLSSHLFGGVKEWTTRAPMLALSDPDPALGFPAGTALQPKVLVRNTSARPFTAHIRFNWRSATASGKTPPMDLALKPNATQAMEVAALQAQKLIPADAYWAAVVISAPIQPDDLMAIAASYDQTGRYGAQTPFSDQLASHWEGGKWEVDSMHDSLLTVGNGGNKPAKAELTILYNQGSGQYQVEQMLAPDEQMLVDFGKLIRNQILDKNGHVLPPDLTSGAYRIRDLEHNPLGALYEGKVIVDKTYGHAAYGCGVCCGPDAPTMAFDPLGVSIDDYADQYVQALDSCGGGVQDFTGDFPTWWTGDTAIATANKNSIHGVAAGTTNHYAESDPMYWGIRKAFNICPVSRPQTTAGTKVERPDHLTVLSDSQQTVNCGSNPSSRVRQITYNVIDTAGSRMQVPFSLKENVPTNIVSSCNQQVVHTGATCTSNIVYEPGALGEFTDFLSPGCPSSPTITVCGFQFVSQQWQWCPTTGVPVSIGTIGPVNAQNTLINVDGNTLGFTPGTTFPK